MITVGDGLQTVPRRRRRMASLPRITTRALLIVVSAMLLSRHALTAQSYSSGQNVSPAYEGWEQNGDGSFNFLFGYMNRNWEEEIDVAVGTDNDIEPGGPDQGQPTRFLPRRNRFVFRVRVPSDFGSREMVWTLTTKGKTEKAFATLRPDYFVNDVVMASETGALGAGTSSPEIRANKRPVVTLDDKQPHVVKVGEDRVWQFDARNGRRVGRTRRQSRVHSARPSHRRQDRRSAPVLVRLPRSGPGAVRSAAGEGMGGHADRCQFPVGAAVESTGGAAGWAVDRAGDVRRARHIRAARARR